MLHKNLKITLAVVLVIIAGLSSCSLLEDNTYYVKYSVSGTSSNVTIYAVEADGDIVQFFNVDLPWEKEYVFQVDGQYTVISVTCMNLDSGDAAVAKIYAKHGDNAYKVIAQDTTSNFYDVDVMAILPDDVK
jgi:hypothetical protein